MSSEVVVKVDPLDGIYWFFHALIVCGSSYEDNLRLMEDEKLFASTCREFSDNLLKNMEQEPGWNITIKLKLFEQYMSYFMDMPVYTPEDTGGRKDDSPSGIDWIQSMFAIFKGQLGYEESVILNMSFKRLFYEWTSYAEANGAIKVENRTTLEQIARAKGLI